MRSTHTNGRSIVAIGVCMLTALVVACGADSTTTVSRDLTQETNTQHGTDSTATPASTGPVASVSVSPRSLYLAPGSALSLFAFARNAAGITVGGKTASWHSSNAAVADVNTSGTVSAKALGSAWIFAAIDGKSDSAQVTVTTTPQDTVVVISAPTGVSAFALTVNVVGVVASGDTTNTAPVAGVTVTVTRTSDAEGHPIAAGGASGTAITDAGGHATISNLTGGGYKIVSTAASGSPYKESTINIAPPQTADAHVYVLLYR